MIFLTDIAFNVSALYTTSVLWFLLHPEMKQESKRIKQNQKLQAILKRKMIGVLHTRWIYSQHTYPRYMQLSKQKWNKYNYI